MCTHPDLVGRRSLGKLEHLQMLHLQPCRDGMRWVQVFDDAPLLSELVLTGSPDNFPRSLPWNQMNKFTFSGESELWTVDQILALPWELMPIHSSFFAHASMKWSAEAPGQCRAVSCRASTIELRLKIVNRSQRALGKLLSRLTFTNLSKLTLRPLYTSGNPTWCQEEFKQLRTQSMFENTLTHLTLLFVIKQTELLETLRTLPALEFLRIGDTVQPALVNIVNNDLLHTLAVPGSMLQNLREFEAEVPHGPHGISRPALSAFMTRNSILLDTPTLKATFFVEKEYERNVKQRLKTVPGCQWAVLEFSGV
uniref:F-box domain-containing protein n=1 Tax=Mycena chlorophos TaxID=658473 RepID=A0ABQ0KYW7_MYCCL|nr:predicted protein [Mycena chlorophos]